MPQEICLQNIKGNRFMVVDCSTGVPVSRDISRGRSKRNPSPYNLHMKECLKRTTGPIQQRFKICAEEWKRKKT